MPKTNNSLLVSIVVPVFNEAKFIENLLVQLCHLKSAEIIIVDGGSTDSTKEIAGKYSEKVLDFAKKQRSSQMNKGAKIARGDYLLFLHADVVLPENFSLVLSEAIQKNVSLANFRLKFDIDH